VGHVEGANRAGLEPSSLYEAQFAERHRNIVLRILTQPQNTILCSGTLLELSVTVEAPEISTVGYQWYKNGTAIQGATRRTLSISRISASDNGAYTVKVSYGNELIESDAAEVTVTEPLPETLQFSGVPNVFLPGNTYHIGIEDPVAGSYPDITAYQWEYSGTGVTFTQRTANPVEMIIDKTATGGTLQARVFHPCGQKNPKLSVTIDQQTGVPENILSNAVIFPNPAANEICIKNIPSGTQITIVGINGKTWYYCISENENETVISVDNFTPGVYVIKLVHRLYPEKSFKIIKE
jgi:hypothetical protein